MLKKRKGLEIQPKNLKSGRELNSNEFNRGRILANARIGLKYASNVMARSIGSLLN
jgi:hypothetical protein